MMLNLKQKRSILLLLLSALGLVAFILISSSGQFRQGIFNQLFPKSSSLAAESRLTPLFDFQSPQVAISYPVKGGKVRINTMVEISALVSDNIRLSKVEFSVADKLICTVSAAEREGRYICNWSIPPDLGITYFITVKAHDLSGNSSSANISVTSK